MRVLSVFGYFVFELSYGLGSPHATSFVEVEIISHKRELSTLPMPFNLRFCRLSKHAILLPAVRALLAPRHHPCSHIRPRAASGSHRAMTASRTSHKRNVQRDNLRQSRQALLFRFVRFLLVLVSKRQQRISDIRFRISRLHVNAAASSLLLCHLLSPFAWS